MPELTTAGLSRLLRESVGDDETVNLEGDLLDASFTDLGYDSLTVLQTTGRIARDHAVRLDEGRVAEAETPRAHLAPVNGAPAVRSRT
ncbi:MULTISPECIES: acyl carrier protein [unclassified Streptomyces]|uniref:acyl carrier protein n=1 Tax=unclassified Streptomyces TaxID=2593676 RepID=UPI0022B61C79|nr:MULTISPECIES: acyl carrier protein [unclassified Streptomyces]MCZ7414668.1 acyl carrier protein [Streptomyces sp. WMMC897]MCZ7431597.1 acyl carrier protein [Streptomyces sp. WMMC1477]